MKDHVASSAASEAKLAVEMLRLHIEHWEHRILATERNLLHAVQCKGCYKCQRLAQDLKRRRGKL